MCVFNGRLTCRPNVLSMVRFCASCISSSSASGSSSSPQKFEVKLKENRRIPSKPVVRKQSKRNQSPSSTADGQEETISKKRPKRQAALLQPDYKALHNSIASSTNKWLGLIANPEKFGRKISDREQINRSSILRVPANLYLFEFQDPIRK